MGTPSSAGKSLALKFKDAPAYCAFVERAAADGAFFVPVPEPLPEGTEVAVRVRVAGQPEVELPGRVAQVRESGRPGVRIALALGSPAWAEARSLAERLRATPAGATQMYGGAKAPPAADGSTQLYGTGAAAPEPPASPASTQMYGTGAAAPEPPASPASTQLYGPGAAAPEAPASPGSTQMYGPGAAAPEAPASPGSTQMYGPGAAAPEAPASPGSTQMYGPGAAAPEAPASPGSTQMYGPGAAAPEAPAAPHQLGPGDLLDGRYRIEAHLASGGMGDVYRATQVYMDRTVALKLLPRRFATDPDMAARFQREARIVSQIEHPQVVRVFDFGRTEGGLLYLAMEFVEGRPLHEVLLEEGALEPARAVALLSGVCSALAEAHAVGIVHRDLKPANVMVVKRRDGREDVKVLDFGIARLGDAAAAAAGSSGMTQAGFVLGTPEYISPEQALAAEIDGRADQYAAGVMAFELLTGRRPFEADSVTRLVSQHVTAAPPHPARIRPALEPLPGLSEAVLRALRKERDERFSDMPAFAAALEAGLTAGASAGAAGPAPVRSGPGARQAGAPFAEAADPAADAAHALGEPAHALGDPAPHRAHASTACPRCTRPVMAGAAFCPGCGTSLVARPCPGCGAESTPGAAFCQRCGHGLEGPATSAPEPAPKREADRPAPPELEAALRELGTAISAESARAVLAARRRSAAAPRACVHVDLSELHRIRDLLEDQEAAEALIRRLRTAIVELGHAHGGALDALTGEGAVLLFDGGADAAERAVRAAASLHGLGDLVRLGLGPKAPPLVRLAVAGGRFEVPTGGGPCTGEAPDRARALAADAEAAVRVGRELGPDCEGHLPLSRAADRADALELTELPLAPLRRAPALTGREPELARLDALLEKGAGTLLMVGDEGLGASRLTEEAAQRGRRAGFAVAAARPPAAGGAFGLLRAVLCRLAGIDEAERVDRLRPALASLQLEPGALGAALAAGGVATVPPGFTPGEAAWAVGQVAGAVAASRPLLLVLDDLHLADGRSLEALASLYARPPARTALLGAGRPVLLAKLKVQTEVLRLGPLVESAVTALAADALGGRPIPERLAEHLFAHARGVPGRALDHLGFLTATGHLALTGPAPVLREPPEHLDPQGALVVRLCGLPPPARRLLAAACLLEAPFDAEAAEATAPGVDATLAWKQLERAGLIAAAGTGRFETTFATDALLGWLAGEGRAGLHRRLAETLRGRLLELDATPPAHRIALHFAEAGVHAEATSWWRRAAESAVRRRCHREAALALESLAEAWGAAAAAGAVAESTGASERMQALTRAALQALAAGAERLAERWLAAAEQVPGASPAAEAERRIALARLKAQAGEAAAAEALLDGLAGETLSAPLQALRQLAWAEHFERAGRNAAAVEAFGAALAAAGEAAPLAAWHGEVDLAARVESQQARLHVLLGNLDEARAAFQRAHARWTRAEHPLSEARLCATLGALMARLKQPAKAAAWYQRGAEAAERAGDLRYAVGQRVNVAKAWRAGGRPADGRPAAGRAADLAERIGWPEGARSARDLERSLAGARP